MSQGTGIAIFRDRNRATSNHHHRRVTKAHEVEARNLNGLGEEVEEGQEDPQISPIGATEKPPFLYHHSK